MHEHAGSILAFWKHLTILTDSAQIMTNSIYIMPYIEF